MSPRALAIGAIVIIGAGVGGFLYLRPPAEVRACETFVKSTLIAPETYERREYTIYQDRDERGRYISTTVHFSAEGRTETRVKDAEICRFEFTGDTRPSDDAILRSTGRAVSHQIGRDIGRKDIPVPVGAARCCLFVTDRKLESEIE